MAANRVAVGGYMNNTLGITDGDLRNALMDEGLENWTAFRTLGVDGIEDLCNNVRKPGGMILMGGNMVPNRGHAVSIMIELKLKQVSYFATYVWVTQCTWNHNQATLARIETLWQYRMQKQNETAGEAPVVKKYTKDCNPRNLFQDIEQALAVAVSDSPLRGNLGYVTRTHVKVPGQNGLPAGHPVLNEEQHDVLQPTIEQDLQRRTRHNGPHWRSDNEKVYNILYAYFHDTEGWAFMKTFHASKMEGRPISNSGLGRLADLSGDDQGTGRCDHQQDLLQWKGKEFSLEVLRIQDGKCF